MVEVAGSSPVVPTRIIMKLLLLAVTNFSFLSAHPALAGDCADSVGQLSASVQGINRSHLVKGPIELRSPDEFEAFKLVTYVDGDLNISRPRGTKGIELDLPNLTGVSGSISIGGAVLLGVLRLSSLVEVLGGFGIASASYPNMKLTGIHAPNFVRFETDGEINVLRATSIKSFEKDIVVGNDEVRNKLFPRH